MNILEGKQAAQTLVRLNNKDYEMVSQKFGGIIDQYLGNVPRALFLSHIMRVNPDRLSAPQIQNSTRGVMCTRIEDARDFSIDWKTLDDPAVCIYVWSRALNLTSFNLYTNYPNIFIRPQEDFWRCSYLKHILGTGAFNFIWQQASITSINAYPKLLETIEVQKRTISGWTPLDLKRIVFRDCEYTFLMAKQKGTLISLGPGVEPAPPPTLINQRFTR